MEREIKETLSIFTGAGMLFGGLMLGIFGQDVFSKAGGIATFFVGLRLVMI